jgi:anthranilate/para-aminobenzoate synthase component II
MKTLLLDNYDSYTYNLFQLIAEVNGGAAPALCDPAKQNPAPHSPHTRPFTSR